MTEQSIPSELREYPNWVCWRLGPPDKPGDKPKKIPVNSRNGHNADSTDPKTWGTWQEAIDRVAKGDVAGVGFVFTDTPFCGTDLDHCRDKDTGIIEPWAQEIIDSLASYAEVSYSETGVHVIVKGDKPGKRCKTAHQTGEVEIYESGRYFAMTGQHLAGTPLEITERQDELQNLYHEVFGLPRGKQAKPSRPPAKLDLTDQELIDKMKASKNGDKIKALMDGDTSGYPSHSEADQALCNYLAFWTDRDPARIDRIFRTSELYRDKWDEKHGERTYGEITIQTALDGTPEGYRPGQQTSEAPTTERVIQAFNCTDLGNAERLVARFGDRLRYTEAWGWLAWDGQRWARDHGLACRYAKETVRAIYDEASMTEDTEKRQKIAKWAVSSEAHSKLQAMLSSAQSELPFDTKAEIFDNEPWLLNCENGTLDLRSGELRDHRPEDLITQLAETAYDPGAQCPTWEAFLNYIMAGNTDLIGFLQQAMGYTLTGDTGEQCLFFCYGTGANGKSTFLEAVRAILGDYGQQAQASTFLEKRQDSSVNNDVARLQGARFVAAVEAGDGKRLAETLIKQMTGKDHITARFLYKEQFDFMPQFKLFLAANHKPTIRGTDLAIWRRIRLIPFNVTIPEDEQDPNMLEKLKAELPGILRWAVEGCLTWQQSGRLRPPQEVTDATAEYRKEMDLIAAFLDDCCTVADYAKVKSGDLHQAYQQYTGDKSTSNIAFTRLLIERGFKPPKRARLGTQTGMYWQGIGLLGIGEIED